jgi:molybdenum transport protein
MMNPYVLADSWLQQLLAEDVPYGDLTSFALELATHTGRMQFSARYDMVLCGSEEARRLGELQGLTAVDAFRPSGSRLLAGEPILTLAGPADALHRVWKTAQTMMEYLSGVATGTANLLAAARSGNPQIALACTRKNFPGTKAAAMKAILCGGALPHRLGLSETLLLFAEHRLFLGSETPEQTVVRLRLQCPERKLVVEVSSRAEAEIWAQAGVDVLQLEKLPPAEVAAVVQMSERYPQRPVVAVAGGVSFANAEAYAATGAQVLVSSAPYQAPPKDVQVTFVTS